MKKITFNALLNHKAHNYKPMQIEVEKVIPLYGKRFEQMRYHPLDDCPEIIENRELMYMEGKELLDTFGIYINKISDMEYREELLKVLIPMQHEAENAAFSDDEDMEETEVVDMTM